MSGNRPEQRQRACSSLNRVVDYTPEYVGYALQNKNNKGGTPMTRLKGCKPLVRAGMLAVVFAATAGIADRSPARADDVTPERLLNADKEEGNWLPHQKNFSAP